MIETKTAALYVRVSTSRQEQEATIESQIEEVKKAILADEYMLPETNTFIDNGWTGSVLARPALDELRDAIKSKTFSRIYVYDLGRLSRDFTNQLILIKEIEESGIKLISLHDINPENEEQGFIRNILGSFHAYERIKIADRFRRGKLYKAKNGIVISGQALYGYNYIKRTETVPTHWTVNDEEADVVERIFRWHVIERMPINSIVRKLSDLGIPTKKGKSRFWTKGPVERILRCETYFTGIAYYNKSEAVVGERKVKKYFKVKKNSRKARPREEWLPFDVPVLIKDKSLYNKSLELLKLNKRFARKNRKYDYLLTGKLFCDHNFPMVGDGAQGTQRYYRSSDKARPRDLRTCDCDGVNVYVLEGLWWRNIKDTISNPSYIKGKIREYAESRSSVNLSLENEKLETKEKLLNLNNQEMKYAQMNAEGLIDVDQLRGLIKQTKDKKVVLIKRLKELDNTNSIKSSISNEEVEELYQKANKVLSLQDYSDKKLVFRDLISKIQIKKGRLVESCINIPLTQYLEYGTEDWDSRPSKCGKVHTF
ncbi:MAG: recombinase family protein [Candidatus Woesebacteria bacterium]|nr:MAG: recombinase family protein [Candidatus Woesebacteria bacterium]